MAVSYPLNNQANETPKYKGKKYKAHENCLQYKIRTIKMVELCDT